MMRRISSRPLPIPLILPMPPSLELEPRKHQQTIALPMDKLLETLPSWVPNHLGTPLRILLILFLTFITMRVGYRIIPRMREMIEAKQQGNDLQRIKTLSQVIQYAFAVMVTVVAGSLILNEVGISITPILGAAGIVGIALGFGAQSLVKDYFTGIFLLLENQIRIGDVVEAGGKSGVVEEVTLRYLRLRDYAGNVHFIPNGHITIVTNMSMGFAFAVMDIGVAYHENIDRVIGVLHAVGRSMREDAALAGRMLDDLEIAGVENLADSAVIVRCRFRVAPLEQWNVRREFLRRVKKAFDEEGIEIPFPHRKLIMASG